MALKSWMLFGIVCAFCMLIWNSIASAVFICVGIFPALINGFDRKNIPRMVSWYQEESFVLGIVQREVSLGVVLGC